MAIQEAAPYVPAQVRQFSGVFDGMAPPSQHDTCWIQNPAEDDHASYALDLDIVGTVTTGNDCVVTVQPYRRSPLGRTPASTLAYQRAVGCLTPELATYTRKRIMGPGPNIFLVKTVNYGAAYTNYSSTLLPDLSSMPAVASGGWCLVGLPDQFQGLDATMSTTNTLGNPGHYAYWSGSAWTAFPHVVDGTDIGQPFSQTGEITWARARDSAGWDTPWARGVDATSSPVLSTLLGVDPGGYYWALFGADGIMSASVTFSAFSIILPIKECPEIVRIAGHEFTVEVEGVANKSGVTDTHAKSLYGSVYISYS